MSASPVLLAPSRRGRSLYPGRSGLTIFPGNR